MTWGEFKDKVEALNVKNSDEIDWIDWDGYSEPELFGSKDAGIAIT